MTLCVVSARAAAPAVSVSELVVVLVARRMLHAWLFHVTHTGHSQLDS